MPGDLGRRVDRLSEVAAERERASGPSMAELLALPVEPWGEPEPPEGWAAATEAFLQGLIDRGKGSPS